MNVFITSVQSVFALVLMILLGYFGQRWNWFNKGFSKSLSKLIMKVALPAAIFVSMVKFFNPQRLANLSTGVVYTALALIIGYVLAWLFVKVIRVPHGRRGIMIVAMNCGNTVFIGLPLNIALFGQISIPYLLTYFIVNTVIIWTLGVWIISSDPTKPSKAKNSKFNWHHLIPDPLWGFIISIPFIFIPFLKHLLIRLTFATTVLKDVGALVTPLALIYIGIMLCDFGIRNMRFDHDVISTLLGRFIIMPIIMFLIILGGCYVGVHIGSIFRQTLIIQSVTPSLAVLPVLADTYHCDIKFSTNIVVSTTVLFIAVVPIIMVIQNL